jgi:hypothetical protein
MRPNPFLDLGERILAKEALEAYAQALQREAMQTQAPTRSEYLQIRAKACEKLTINKLNI